MISTYAAQLATYTSNNRHICIPGYRDLAASLVGERRGLRTTAQQQTGAIAGSRIVSDSLIRSTAPQRRLPLTALMAWPNFHREMETEVDKQVVAPAETRTPDSHRAKQKSGSLTPQRTRP